MVNNTLAECLQRQIAQKIFESKIEASDIQVSKLVTMWLSNIAFHLLLILLQTLVAINSESPLTLFPSFCMQPSEFCCAVPI